MQGTTTAAIGATTHPIEYRMERNPDWKVFLNMFVYFVYFCLSSPFSHAASVVVSSVIRFDSVSLTLSV